MAKATCPECDGCMRLGRQLRLGQRYLCPHCCTVIEVSSVLPLELDWAYAYDESEGSLLDVWCGSQRDLVDPWPGSGDILMEREKDRWISQ